MGIRRSREALGEAFSEQKGDMESDDFMYLPVLVWMPPISWALGDRHCISSNGGSCAILWEVLLNLTWEMSTDRRCGSMLYNTKQGQSTVG